MSNYFVDSGIVYSLWAMGKQNTFMNCDISNFRYIDSTNGKRIEWHGRIPGRTTHTARYSV